jgi:hypothetical protein
MIDLEYPECQEPHLKAMREPLDLQAQIRQVEEAELAISLRLEELQTSLDGHLERQAIQDALDALLFLRKEKLKLADWERVPARREPEKRAYSLPAFFETTERKPAKTGGAEGRKLGNAWIVGLKHPGGQARPHQGCSLVVTPD